MSKLLITVIILLSLVSCSCPRKQVTCPESEIRKDETGLYTLKLTEKGLKRIKTAIELYEKGMECGKGYGTGELVLYITFAAIVAGATGYAAGR